MTVTTAQTAPVRTARTARRRRVALMAAVPVATAALVAWHPSEPRDVRILAESTDVWIAIHLGLLLAVPMIAIVVWQLLRGIDNRAAAVSRFLLAPAVALYAAFDALIGIATGVLMRQAAAMPAPHDHGAWLLAQQWWDVPGPIVVIGVLGPLSWALAVGAAAYAHYRAGSHPLVATGLALTAVVFAWGHPGLTGVAAMGGLLAAVVAAERQWSRSARSASP